MFWLHPASVFDAVLLSHRDAAWELEPNAFNELVEMYNHCDAEVCLNPDGRDMFVDQANK